MWGTFKIGHFALHPPQISQRINRRQSRRWRYKGWCWSPHYPEVSWFNTLHYTIQTAFVVLFHACNREERLVCHTGSLTLMWLDASGTRTQPHVLLGGPPGVRGKPTIVLQKNSGLKGPVIQLHNPMNENINMNQQLTGIIRATDSDAKRDTVQLETTSRCPFKQCSSRVPKHLSRSGVCIVSKTSVYLLSYFQ